MGRWRAKLAGGIIAVVVPVALFVGAEPAAGLAGSSTPTGYWLASSGGGFGVIGYGQAHTYPVPQPPQSVVGIGSVTSAQGYWLVTKAGGVFSFGAVQFFGSAADVRLVAPVVGMAVSPDGRGYWLAAADGGVFTYGDARFFGSASALHPAVPVVGVTATPDGGGYWMVGEHGAVFSFGDAHFYGAPCWAGGGGRAVSEGPGGCGPAGMPELVAPVVGMASTPDGQGYWLVTADGGVFSFGDAHFFGSMAGKRLNAPVVGMAPTPDGSGYWLAAADAGVFTFGDAPFLGSGPDYCLPETVGIAVTTAPDIPAAACIS